MRIFKLAAAVILSVCMCPMPQIAAKDGGGAVMLETAKLSGGAMVAAGELVKLNISVTGLNGGRRVMLSAGGNLAIAEEGSRTLFINGEEKEMEAAACMHEGQLYVPLEVLSPFNYSAEMNGENAAVSEMSEVEKRLAQMETADGMYLSGELLQNPSFEQDFMLYGGWSSRSGGKIMQTDEQAVEGKYSGLVAERTAGWSAISQSVTSVFSEYGKGKYRISGYVMPKDEAANMTVKIQLKNTENKQYDFSAVSDVKGGEWNRLEAVCDIQWDYDVSTAVLYSEMTSNKGQHKEVQDFYADSFSLRKLMTREECVKYLTAQTEEEEEYEAKKKADYEKYTALSEKYSGEKLVTVYPEEDRQILKNPYKGLMMYPYYTTAFSGDLSTGAGTCSGVMYMRYSWDRIEPEEGVFNWDMFDANIEFCKKYNMQMGMGIGSTVNYNVGRNYHQDTPSWVFDAGAAYTVEKMEDGSELKVPVYEDPIFREKLQTMIDAFAERYGGNENIAFVDMRNYGNWGEWHFYQLPVNRQLASQRTQKQLFELIDMWKAVDLPLLAFVARTDVAKYANKTLGAGLRCDGIMNPNLLNEHMTLNLVRNKGPAVGEWYADSAAVYLPGGSYAKYYEYMPTFYERVITESGMSIAAVANWLPEVAYAEWPDLYNRMANLVGYWYKPVKIEYSEGLSKGIFKMKIKNDGVAPLFAGREKKACVKLALADKDNNIIDTVVLDGVDPIDWHGGEYTDCAAEYSFAQGKEGAKLLLGVFTRESNTEPNIKLGIKADCINGWYDISSMRASDAENLGHNKKYTASHLYADDNYGFRRPEYAFDNNRDTFWANSCISGNYLEIDFGEEKDISGVKIIAAEDIKEKISIQKPAGSRWSSVADADVIGTAGTELRFRRITADKLRIVLRETKDAVIKISEIEIY